MIRKLPVKLTPAEIQAKGELMAEKEIEIRDLRLESKNVAKSFKQDIDRLDLEMSALGKEIRSRSEYRSIECIERPNYTKRVMEITRIDTEELVESRPLTEQEMQQSLSFQIAH